MLQDIRRQGLGKYGLKIRPGGRGVSKMAPKIPTSFMDGPSVDIYFLNFTLLPRRGNRFMNRITCLKKLMDGTRNFSHLFRSKSRVGRKEVLLHVYQQQEQGYNSCLTLVSILIFSKKCTYLLPKSVLSFLCGGTT